MIQARKEFEQKFAKMEEYERETDPMKKAKLYMERHTVELVVLAAIFASTLNYLAGRSLNAKLAFKWLKTVEKPLAAAFTYMPEDCRGDEEGTIRTFDDYTSREYPIALSGRESCKYAAFNFVAKPRHDIATTILTTLPLINKLFQTQRDIVWVDIPIERASKVHSEILLVQQRELESVYQSQPHLKILMQPVSPNTVSEAHRLDKSLVCLAENQESVDALFADPTLATALGDPTIAN